jgi:hypothetical protein
MEADRDREEDDDKEQELEHRRLLSGTEL